MLTRPTFGLNFTLDAADAEFVASEVAFLMTPPSPIHARLVVVICSLMFVILAAAWIGRVDIYATGSARIQPTGRSKVVQPLVAGKVHAIHVNNGAHVNAGDVLIELDPTQTQADLEISEKQLSALDAEIARRSASIEVARSGHFMSLPKIGVVDGLGQQDQQREQDVFETDLANLGAGLDSLSAQIAEKRAEESALGATISQQELLVESLQNRRDMRKELFARQLESRVNVLEANESLVRELKTLADLKGNLLTTRSAIEAIKSQKVGAVASFIAQNSQARADAQRRRNEVAQGLIKNSDKVSEMRLLAPLSGVVEQLAVTTVGQVVTAGQQMLIVVPENATLEAEALVPDKDVGFVRLDQDAVIKIDTFPFARYGTLSGKVVRISGDAIASQEARMLADASAGSFASQHDALSPVPETTNLVYAVHIKLASRVMEIDGKSVPLIPGMSATVEIKTGRRRLLEYFLSPLFEAGANAGHER